MLIKAMYGDFNRCYKRNLGLESYQRIIARNENKIIRYGKIVKFWQRNSVDILDLYRCSDQSWFGNFDNNLTRHILQTA